MIKNYSFKNSVVILAFLMLLHALSANRGEKVTETVVVCCLI